MSVLKCKICGGIVEPKENGIGVCDSCGTKQTIPKFGNDRVNSFLDKANNYRNAGEFDKAIDIYEKLLDNNEAEDPELYWDIVLSKYGVKYEKDPVSKEYIPTVNRLQFTSILQDNDYKKALELADSEQKKVYIEQAEAIDKIQQEILRISKSEEPYDIFICYKETDENNKRTQDSLYAYKLYEKLTNEGYKVFFARVTLEDKIGKYEPYIFAALHSAKVMLVIGTKKEYFDAVWVKNEWSRYLQLLKDKSVKRNIVPCYKDMDPYDLPEELAYLQAQDMNKVGFEEDLIRGISKIVKVKKVNDSQNVDINNLEISRLLKRIKTYIDDGDFINANTYCEKALDVDAENADVYFYQLLAQKGVKSLDEMKQKELLISDNIIEKIKKLGSGKYDELIIWNKELKEKIEKQKIEHENSIKQIVEDRNNDKDYKIMNLLLYVRFLSFVPLLIFIFKVMKTKGMYRDLIKEHFGFIIILIILDLFIFICITFNICKLIKNNENFKRMIPKFLVIVGSFIAYLVLINVSDSVGINLGLMKIYNLTLSIVMIIIVVLLVGYLLFLYSKINGKYKIE